MCYSRPPAPHHCPFSRQTGLPLFISRLLLCSFISHLQLPHPFFSPPITPFHLSVKHLESPLPPDRPGSVLHLRLLSTPIVILYLPLPLCIYILSCLILTSFSVPFFTSWMFWPFYLAVSLTVKGSRISLWIPAASCAWSGFIKTQAGQNDSIRTALPRSQAGDQAGAGSASSPAQSVACDWP